MEMKDYQKRLDQFTNNTDKKKIEEYMKKYWLNRQELNTTWLPIKNSVFTHDFHYPDQVFNTSFDTIISIGFFALAEDDLKQFQECIKVTGDKYFVLVEDYDEEIDPVVVNDGRDKYTQISTRLKYPSDISWEEIKSGDWFSKEVFEGPVRDFFIFGDSGLWGKYAGNDQEYELDIIGYDKKYTDVFQEQFKNNYNNLELLKSRLAHYGISLPE
jgi:hypothetical protein